jgi:hypothetical protein
VTPSDIVAAQIRRANPSIGKEAARQLAVELSDILACTLRRWKASPGFGVINDEDAGYDIDGADGIDLIQTLTYAIIDKDFSASEVEHLGHVFSVLFSVDISVDHNDDLYPRYLRLSERINGAEAAVYLKQISGMGLNPPAKEPKLYLVRDDGIPSLDALKQALVAAVRLAQRGEGPRKILDLLPAFKDSSGLDFIMNATEAHRGGLFDLARDAGIPVA